MARGQRPLIRLTWLALAGVLVCLGAAAPSAGRAGRPLTWQPGDTREFLFIYKGDRIGQLITQITRGRRDHILIRDNLNYRYESEQEGVPGPKIITLYHNSELEVRGDGSPIRFTMFRESPGTRRNVSMTFEPDKVLSVESTVGFDVRQETPLPPHSLVVADHLISAWSLVTQSLPLDDQDIITLSVFAADKLTPLLVTVKVVDRTSIPFGAESAPVLVCTITPLPGKFYLHAATQEILRYEAGEDLVVQLVAPAAR